MKDVCIEGRGFGQMRTSGGSKGPCGRPQASTFFIIPVCLADALCG